MGNGLETLLGENLGDFLFAFCCWLTDEVAQISPDRIVFVSREGWFLGRCWELVAPLNRPEVHFVRASRRALALSESTETSLIDRLEAPAADCGLDYFVKERYGLTLTEEDSALVRKAGFVSSCQLINRKKSKHKLAKLILALAPKCERIRKEQHELAKRYYCSFEMNQGRSLIVDVGYNGTFQAKLSDLFPRAEFHGRYVATFRKAKAVENCKGWILNGVENQTKLHPLTRNLSVVEFLLMTTDGSLRSFRWSGKERRVKPLLGKPLPREALDFLQKVQTACLRRIERLERTYEVRRVPLNIRPHFGQRFLKMIDKPSAELVGQLSRFHIDDSFGGSDVRFFFFTPRPPAGDAIKDKYEYLYKSSWTGGARFLLTKDKSIIESINILVRIKLMRTFKLLRWWKLVFNENLINGDFRQF